MGYLQTSEQFGRLTGSLNESKEYLTIHFSPSASARQERWRNYGLSADFLGDYFSNFFPGNALTDNKLNQRDVIKSAISFIANELLENAIKYHEERVQQPISISLYLFEDRIIFKSENYANTSATDDFKAFIRNLVNTDDLDTLFTQQLEKAAMGTGESNMGLLTMMCDYNVEFGWKFEMMPHSTEFVRIEVLACFNI